MNDIKWLPSKLAPMRRFEITMRFLKQMLHKNANFVRIDFQLRFKAICCSISQIKVNKFYLWVDVGREFTVCMMFNRILIQKNMELKLFWIIDIFWFLIVNFKILAIKLSIEFEEWYIWKKRRYSNMIREILKLIIMNYEMYHF